MQKIAVMLNEGRTDTHTDTFMAAQKAPRLDDELLFLTRRKTREGTLTPEEVLAVNVLYRKKVRVPVLEKVFSVGRNAIYRRALTGYPSSSPSTAAARAHAIIDRIGLEAAYRKYVTPEMVADVHRHATELLERKRYKSELVQRRRRER